MSATFFLVTSWPSRVGEIAHEDMPATFDAAVKLFEGIDDAHRIIEIDPVAGTSKDRTRDALVIFANRSFNEAEKLHYDLEGRCDAYDVPYFRAREVYDYV